MVRAQGAAEPAWLSSISTRARPCAILAIPKVARLSWLDWQSNQTLLMSVQEGASLDVVAGRHVVAQDVVSGESRCSFAR